ncbi:MAG: hypothetical protein R3B90_02085 [Planctomycetaceae bacterium]
MTDRSLQSRVTLAATCIAVLLVSGLRADEPNAAPPLELPLVAPPAPLPVTAEPLVTSDSQVTPVARRNQNGIEAEQLYYGDSYQAPGQFVYSEGDASGYLPGFEYNPDEAAVRISDLPAEQQGMDVPGVKASRLICPHCRYCEHGLPFHECPECEPTRKDIRQYTRRHGLRLPPDYGWAPPARAPIDRVSIDYYRAFPGQWTGQPQAAVQPIVRPQVYWPTDTTQLGYTYQQTPHWMPYPGMVPPVPHPGQWHLPLCGTCGPNVGVGHANCPHCRPGAAGHGHSHQPANEGWAPEESEIEVVTPPQAAALPTGPTLTPSGNSPNLAPVPF